MRSQGCWGFYARTVEYICEDSLRNPRNKRAPRASGSCVILPPLPGIFSQCRSVGRGFVLCHHPKRGMLLQEACAREWRMLCWTVRVLNFGVPVPPPSAPLLLPVCGGASKLFPFTQSPLESSTEPVSLRVVDREGHHGKEGGFP